MNAFALGRAQGERSRLRPLWLVTACLALAAGLGLASALGPASLPLLAVVLIAMTLAMLVWPETATLTFILALYLNAPVVAISFYGVPSVVAAGSFLLLALPLTGYLLRRQPIVIAPALPLMLLLLAVAIVSAVQSRSIGDAMSWISVYLTEGLLLFFLTTNVIRTPQTVIRVVWVLLVAGAIMGGLSIVQETTHTYSNAFGGFAQLDRRGQAAGSALDAQPRLAGPIGEQNRYGQVLLVLIPLGIGFAVRRRRRRERLVAMAATALILGGMLLSYSRGAAVALAAVLVLMVLLRFVRLRQVLLVGAGVVVVALLVAPGFFDRIASLQGLESLTSSSGDTTADGSIQGRAALNLGALQAVIDHPVLGVGPGLFAADYSAAYANETGIHHFLTSSQFPAHNLYLGIAADLGLVGFAVFMAILLLTAWLLWGERRRWQAVRADYSFLATAMLLSLAAYAASGVFLHLAYERYFWFLVALANATVLVLRAAPLEPESGSEATVVAGDRIGRVEAGREPGIVRE